MNNENGFDGDYVHFPQEIKTCLTWENALDIMKDLHTRKVWNASWFCTFCWREIYNEKCGTAVGLEVIRDKLAITEQRSAELDRRRERTRHGAWRNNQQPRRRPPSPIPKRRRQFV